MRTHEVAVLTEHLSPVSKLPYAEVWVYESEQIARVEMLDMREYSPQLWLQAPEGYLRAVPSARVLVHPYATEARAEALWVDGGRARVYRQMPYAYVAR